MKYYRLEREFRSEILGASAQSETMTEDYPYNAENSVWNLGYDKDLVPNLDAIQLVKNAKLTDLLSCVTIPSFTGIVVSEAFKKVLERFNLPQHRFFPARVVNSRGNDVEYQYYLFRVVEYQNQCIDFDKSEFCFYDGNDLGDVEIQRAQDIEDVLDAGGLGVGVGIFPRFITLFPKAQYDIFSFRRFAGYHVSERLKNAIDSVGLTGIRFEKPSFPILQEEINS